MRNVLVGVAVPVFRWKAGFHWAGLVSFAALILLPGDDVPIATTLGSSL
jgi:hypothetical protein